MNYKEALAILEKIDLATSTFEGEEIPLHIVAEAGEKARQAIQDCLDAGLKGDD